VRPADIDRFFSLLGKRLPFAVRVTLTGGGAAILEGVQRATRDLDFQISLGRAPGKRHVLLQDAIRAVEAQTGIAAQYEESIETWSSIAWPEARARSYRYKRFGRVDVHLLDPLWWSVGKMTRYLDYDVSDVITVFKKMKVRPEQAVRAWGKALGRSPMSNAQSIFQRQVLGFLDRHARPLWGKSVDVSALQALFLSTARRASDVDHERLAPEGKKRRSGSARPSPATDLGSG
jgi:hypothetical protein